MALEEQVLEYLRATQSNTSQTRVKAELHLRQIQREAGYASALVTIGAHTDLSAADRVSALVALRNFVGTVWSPSLEDFGGRILVSDEEKEGIRSRLLTIVFGDHADSKIVNVTAGVISKVAKADFPEEWPSLVDSLLQRIGHSSNDQAQGILVVLSELLADGLDEEQFYRYGAALVSSLRDVATDANRSLMVRAHAVNVFKESFDFVENLKDKEEDGIRHFTQGVCDAWAPFFLQVLQEPMPKYPTDAEEADVASETGSNWRGATLLKTQALTTLAKVQSIFPDLMPAQEFFEACWSAIRSHGEPYYMSYVEGERQSGLVNQYQLPYSFDFLIIEEIDYLQNLLEAPLVQQHLNGMRDADKASNGNSVSVWLASVLRTLVTFSSITKEAEEMWDLDYNVFLSEETFAETNNTPRSVCAGFVWKLCGWFPKETLESLLEHTKNIFDDSGTTWRIREATLFALQQVAEEFENESRSADPNVIRAALQIIHPTMSEGHHLLRARGHIATAAVLGAFYETLGTDNELLLNYAHLSLQAIENDESDVVRTACIRIMRDYLTTLPSSHSTGLQNSVVNAIARFLESQKLEEMDENVDLLDVVLQTLRDTIMANPATCLEHNALDVLLMMVKYGAARDHNSSVLINEAFESAAEAMAELGPDAYARLCQKLIPSLMAAFDVENPKIAQKSELTDVAVDTLRVLAESAKNPLPPGFVNSAMPRLCRLIFSDVDFYVRQSATLTIKHMLDNDKDQVFNWTDPDLGKGGLEMCFLVIGHLLGPSIDDASAAEVGELAVSIFEKADPSVIGTSMHELLQIVAARLQVAEHPGLIQSLVTVFAHLCSKNSADAVQFLINMQVGDATGLEVVLRKWLENSTAFVGFEAIKQSLMSLIDIYRLHDPRIEAVMVNGDMIPDDNSRIRTRSQAKTRPIRHTIVAAPLKIIKVLVSELLDPGILGLARDKALQSEGIMPGSTLIPKTQRHQRADDSDDEWESEDEDNLFGHFTRGTDDETQNLLTEFFRAEGADSRFQEAYAALTEEEKARLMTSLDGTGGN